MQMHSQAMSLDVNGMTIMILRIRHSIAITTVKDE